MNRAVYQEKCRHSFAYDSTPLYSRDNEFGDPAGKMGVCLDDRCSSYVALDKGEYQRVVLPPAQCTCSLIPFCLLWLIF